MLRSSLPILLLVWAFSSAQAQDEAAPGDVAVPEEAFPSDPGEGGEMPAEANPESPPGAPEIAPEETPPSEGFPADEAFPSPDPPQPEDDIEFFDEGVPEDQGVGDEGLLEPAGDEYMEEEARPATALPLRAAPMEPEEPIVRDPSTSTAATYGERFRNKEEGKKVLFGQYRIRLSVAKPEFDDGLKFYDQLYGDEKRYPMLAADWFAYDWYVTFGLSLRAGYYSAKGHTANEVGGADATDLNASDIEKNLNGPTALTLIPFQFAATMEFTPFPGKYLVMDAWIGVERMYWQETRTASAGEAASDDSAPSNTGWTSATTVGVSANILLNPLDDRGARSLHAIGLGYIYLSPYMEIVRTLSDKDVPFGRSIFGIGFTFESVR